MPCDRVARASATVALNLEQYLKDDAKMRALVSYLRPTFRNVNDLLRGVRFRGSHVEMSGYAYDNLAGFVNAIKTWTARENQLRVLAVMQSLGATIVKTAMDAQGGAAFQARLKNIQLSVHVDINGYLTIATDNGTFEDGKKLIEGSLRAMQAAGVTISGVTAVETHKEHATIERNRITVNAIPGEDGYHTH